MPSSRSREAHGHGGGCARAGFGAAALVLGASALVFGLCLPASARAQNTAAAPVPALPEAGQAPVGEGASVQSTIPETDAARDARDLSLQRPVHRSWQLVGEVAYRTLLVRDTDPANDQRMNYRLAFSYEPLERLLLSVRAGATQRFVSVEGESGLRLEDTALSALLQQPVALDGLGWDRTLALVHRARVYLPTSFRSQQDDLLFAAEWMTRARVRLTGQLFAGLRGILQYYAYDYAEQAGLGGLTLPRFVAEAQTFAEYSPLVSAEHGTLTFGADVYVNQTIDYPSGDPGDVVALNLPPGTLDADSIRGAGSTDTFSSPNLGFDVYMLYQPPIEHVLLTASIGQIGGAMRYGEYRVNLFNRDETELAVGVLLTY
jgi:hypothetical protein